jgi:hypothetical protein
MATDQQVAPQSMVEVRTHLIDFTNDLPSAVTVSTATATHTPPSGSATTPTVSVTLAPIVSVTLGPLTVLGLHLLSVVATLSDGEKVEVRLKVPVNF